MYDIYDGSPSANLTPEEYKRQYKRYQARLRKRVAAPTTTASGLVVPGDELVPVVQDWPDGTTTSIILPMSQMEAFEAIINHFRDWSREELAQESFAARVAELGRNAGPCDNPGKALEEFVQESIAARVAEFRRNACLSDNARAVLRVLQTLPAHEGRTGKELESEGVTQSTLTGHVIPELKAAGYPVKNRRGIGYYLEHRP
jgi:hypothetical protein